MIKKYESPSRAPLEIVVVMDRSGSMQEMKESTIQGYNQFLTDQKKLFPTADFTLIQFNHQVTILPTVKLHTADPLTSRGYTAEGNTALFDAMGDALSALMERSPEKAIILVITDGEENCSRRRTRASVKAQVQEAEAKGYEVSYIGNIDLDYKQQAWDLGIKMGSTYSSDFKSQAGNVERGATMSASVKSYVDKTREKGTI
jgi:Mg-chelatase subunit ChlD